MAKRREEVDETRRRSRKEVLLERRHQRQTRQARIAIGIVVGLLVLVLLLGLIIEGVVRPRQAVAEVNGDTIALNDWQDRVRFQRAQFIIGLEDQLEAFGDLGLVQQFSQQQISLLLQPELLGELVLEQMIDEQLVQQLAEEQGIEVTDEEVDEAIGETFNYFGGAAPTPLPTPTATIEPTPSLTPISSGVITDEVPAETFPTPTQGPTGTPLPTATPVSEEAFREEYNDYLDRLKDLGVSEGAYRDAIRAQLYREQLAERLAEDADLPTEAEHASAYVLAFQSQEAAEAARDTIDEEGFLTVWNTIRSAVPAEGEVQDANATEVLWRTQDQLAQQFGEQVAELAITLPVGVPSPVIEPAADQAAEQSVSGSSYYIIQVSGREMRELPASTVDNLKQELVTGRVEELRTTAAIEQDPIWRARVPTQPVLDPAFLVQPTQPPLEVPATPAE